MDIRSWHGAMRWEWPPPQAIWAGNLECVMMQPSHNVRPARRFAGGD
jgi:hypothetical protein